MDADLLVLPIAAFIVTFIECVVLYVILLGLFRLFRGSARMRNRVYYIASYPGAFAFGSGTVGVAFPIPSILGVPISALFLTQSGNATWMPAPLLMFQLGFDAPGPIVATFVISEIMLIVAWYAAMKLAARPPGSAPTDASTLQ